MKKNLLTTLLLLLLVVFAVPVMVYADGTCTHSNQTHYAEKEANCCGDGYAAYSQCNDCNALFDGSGSPIGAIPSVTNPDNHTSIQDVSGTEGNCCSAGTQAHKKCGGCGRLFDLSNAPISSVPQTTVNTSIHTSIAGVGATDSTCCTNGNIAYYRCGGCGALFADASGSESIALSDTKLPFDDNNHSTYISDIATVVPTCCTTGTEAHRKCGGCGKLFDTAGNPISAPVTIPFDAENHSNYIAEVSAVASTCCTTGNESYYRCGGCGKLFRDLAGTETISAVPKTEINAANHSNIAAIDKVSATCCTTGIAEHKKCTGCGKLFDTSDAPIDSTEKLAVDPSNHSILNLVEEVPANCAVGGVAAHYKCGGCGKLFEDDKGTKPLSAVPKTDPNPAKHSKLNPVEEIPANCAVGGVAAHYKCGGCGKLFEDENGTKPLDAAPKTSPDPAKHSKLNLVEGVPATCTTEGIKEYYKCGGCGKLFADKDGLTALSTPEVLPPDKEAHSWDSGVVTRKSTCSVKGNKRFTCTRDSGHHYDQPLALNPTAHNWNSGTVTTPATCITEGIMTFTCQNDSKHTYTEKIAATGKHDHSVITNDHKYHTYTCSTKGCKSSVTEKHDFTRWKTIREATAEKHGLLRRVCKDCGYKSYKKSYFSTIPKTGDAIVLAAAALTLSVGGLTGATVYKKKKKK